MILTTNNNLISKSDVICTDISDHFPLNLKTDKPKTIKIMARSFKNYNPTIFCQDVAMITWNALNNFDQVHDKVNGFNILFGEIVDKHAPIKEMIFKHKGNPPVLLLR